MLLLFLNTSNPAAKDVSHLFDDSDLRRRASFVPFITSLEGYLEEHEPADGEGGSILHLLRRPMLASPDSLAGQIEFIRQHWGHLLPDELLTQLQLALDVLKEVDVSRHAEYGSPPVLEFGPGSRFWADGEPEPEAFSRDADWMSNVVLMAKSVHVWLDQLSRWHGRPVHTLADIPDAELDRLARWGVTGLWLIGLWERSEASRLIKQYMGNPEAAASAYALRDYHIAAELGGEEGYANLRRRAADRGIRLASDMVPNHMGIDSRWVIEHPDWFLQAEQPPFPGYRFTGGDLCTHGGVSVRIEDGYWDHSDAAVVFQRVDESTGQARYIYHGNDGTSMPWNDTAQLNFMLPEVREAVTQVILDVARRFPIIRFDAAMTLAKKHYQRLWFPAPGDAGAIPSRAEHGMTKERFNEVFPVEFWRQVVDRVAAEAPDTLLLAEAFWLMEGYFVRTLGMHRVYNSAFMNMLKMEDNAKYRQTLKNVLEYSPPILQRFVNFMNNPDEKTAVEQFGRGDKYFGCAILLVTLPGLPMLGHGQIEGFSEKYGMEYRRAYWDENIDDEMVARHEREVFPLMRRRHLFSGAEHFHLFDFESGHGHVDENVFAYTNRCGEERALIIYNNSYEQTSGHVRTSSAVNVGSAESPHLVHRSLAEALQLEEGRNIWYAFRDHSAGLEFLRHSSELVRDGFHTQLDGYQYRTLVDFRRLEDSDGSWAELAAWLQGGGTPDLELAARRRLIAPALAELIPPVVEAVAPELAMAEEIFAALGKDRDENGHGADKVAGKTPGKTADKTADTAEPPLRPGERTRKDLRALRRELADGTILRADQLADELSRWPGPWGGPEQLAAGGLTLRAADGPLLLEELTARLAAALQDNEQARRIVGLAILLVRNPDAARHLAAGEVRWLAQDLRQPSMKEFLDVNTHQGTEYFRRESLQILLAALTYRALRDNPQQKPANLLDARALLLTLAEQSGFRTRDFQATLQKDGPA
ncbi:alpha-amylase [bacterium DOLZORAL124_64_63]|nr:MAG: alpha-amylase [bacterium DOLZORAL124_64_63]